jgi:hypothetical protein
MNPPPRQSTELDWPHVKTRAAFVPKRAILELAVRTAHEVEGDIIEFGVAWGKSTRVIRRALRRLERGQIVGTRKRIFACDSFKGLPEKFENAAVGTFATEPPRIRGVEIVAGYFAESLTPELARRVGQVSLASLDADLYSSTLCALQWLTPLLHSGSLLLFDEFLGENESEKRAFETWSDETGVRTVQIAEFLREPSGWGTRPDRRVLFQIVGDEELKRRRVVNLGTALDRFHTLRLRAARRLRRIVHR